MPEEITPEENERRFKDCLESIHNLTHEKLVKLMGKEWLEDYRRRFHYSFPLMTSTGDATGVVSYASQPDQTEFSAMPINTTTQLSPQAQSVLNALLEAKFGKEAVELGFPVMSVILGRELAAALRAAVGHDVYKADLRDQMEVMFSEGWNSLRKEILAIADELEAQ